MALRSLANSKSVKRRSISKNADLYIYKLNVLLEYTDLIATRRQYLKDVKVEKVKSGMFVVGVSSEKGGDKPVAILEAFEEMGINVEQARVSCDNGFTVEAIAVAEDQTLDVADDTEPLLKAIGPNKMEKRIYL